MTNELLFIFHSIFISLCTLGFFALGPYALVTFISIQCLLANLFVLKQTTLFGFNATTADPFTIGALFSLNLLQEYWGKEITRSAIFINMAMLIFYTIVSQIHLAYTASSFDTMQPVYASLLTPVPRIVIASILVYYLSQMVDYAVFGILKSWWHNKYLVARMYTSTAISQAVDTVLFSFLGLYAIVDNIWQIILVSYIIKLIAIFLTTPFIALSKKITIRLNSKS